MNKEPRKKSKETKEWLKEEANKEIEKDNVHVLKIEIEKIASVKPKIKRKWNSFRKWWRRTSKRRWRH